MALDAFLKIEGIPGEALDEQCKDWIEITGYSFGTYQSASVTASTAGGATSGRTTLSNLTLKKMLDKSSCKLMAANCAGEHFKEVKLSVHRAGGDKMKFYEIILEEVIIAEYNQIANDGIPTELIQLNYGRIRSTYTLQKRNDGGAAGSVTGGWDRIGNKQYC